MAAIPRLFSRLKYRKAFDYLTGLLAGSKVVGFVPIFTWANEAVAKAIIAIPEVNVDFFMCMYIVLLVRKLN
jgi:hypothetical protein